MEAPGAGIGPPTRSDCSRTAAFLARAMLSPTRHPPTRRDRRARLPHPRLAAGPAVRRGAGAPARTGPGARPRGRQRPVPLRRHDEPGARGVRPAARLGGAVHPRPRGRRLGVGPGRRRRGAGQRRRRGPGVGPLVRHVPRVPPWSRQHLHLVNVRPGLRARRRPRTVRAGGQRARDRPAAVGRPRHRRAADRRRRHVVPRRQAGPPPASSRAPPPSSSARAVGSAASRCSSSGPCHPRGSWPSTPPTTGWRSPPRWAPRSRSSASTRPRLPPSAS